MTKRSLCALCVLVCSRSVFARGDGPRTWLPAPSGTNALSPIYMRLDSNMNFQQTILVEDADVVSDVFVLTYVGFFSLGGSLSEVLVTGIFGRVSGSVDPGSRFAALPELKIPLQAGVANPTFNLRVGLFGAPALDLPEFMKAPPIFQGYVLFAAAPTLGSYDSERTVTPSLLVLKGRRVDDTASA